jgi:hypothetical protein
MSPVFKKGENINHKQTEGRTRCQSWITKVKKDNYQPDFIKAVMPEATSKVSPSSYNNVSSWKAAY